MMYQLSPYRSPSLRQNLGKEGSTSSSPITDYRLPVPPPITYHQFLPDQGIPIIALTANALKVIKISIFWPPIWTTILPNGGIQ
jgi:hypothetical protein